MKSLSTFYALLLCAALLTSCSKTPQISPIANDDVVLAFGDSLTFGTGASPGASYPAQLQILIGRKVVNAGVPGEISSDGLQASVQMLPAQATRYLERRALAALVQAQIADALGLPSGEAAG